MIYICTEFEECGFSYSDHLEDLDNISEKLEYLRNYTCPYCYSICYKYNSIEEFNTNHSKNMLFVEID